MNLRQLTLFGIKHLTSTEVFLCGPVDLAKNDVKNNLKKFFFNQLINILFQKVFSSGEIK